MIYLNNTQESQVLFVPKNGTTTSGSLSLRLRNTIDHDVTLDGVVDLNTSDLYFNLAIALPADIEDGEYEYTLLNGNIELSTGLLVVGGSSSSPSQYEKSIEYEQYKSE